MNPETAQRDRKAQEIFGQWLELSEPAARAGFLAGACGDDPLLRQRVEALLASHLEDDFLERPPGDLESKVMAAAPATDNPGDQVGRYKLLEKLGEGGFGVVFMAEQREPVKRRVALKIIKLGMDTHQVIARFEAERQALALMDHPNIAKFLDAGVTGPVAAGVPPAVEPGVPPGGSGVGASSALENSRPDPGGKMPPSTAGGTPAATLVSPRPYFVMELVRGIRITDYCAQKHLSTRQRLDLFTAVCHAVQHAHQKGIIHRDLKPSNILVTENDGVPVPKVIDFGIAKATEQKLTDKTLFTQFTQFLGTPAYMSPEQAAMTSLDIDTRSDIYSLGVLLYELLTGTTPFDAQELLKAGFDEMRRIIRETEPERPSTRLTTLQGRRGAAEKGRSLDPDGVRLSPGAGSSDRQAAPECSKAHVPSGVSAPEDGRTPLRNPCSAIDSDLDWIVMKCLEKDRARRYETANGLAADIQRHLRNEPILARPPSRLYQFRKLARRNRVAFAAAAAVMVALLTGLTLATWAFVRERAARRQMGIEAAKSQQVAAFLKDMIRGVEPSVAMGRDVTVLREIADQTLQRMSGEQSLPPETEVQLRATLGGVYHHLGDYQRAEAMHRETLPRMRKLLGNEHPEVAELLRDFACVREDLNKHKESEALGREALALSRRLHGPEHPDVAKSLELIARTLTNQRKFAEGEALLRQSLVMNRKVQGPEHRDVANGLGWLAEFLADQGRSKEAEAVFQQALAMIKKMHPDVHPDVAKLLSRFAEFQQKHRKFIEAEQLYRELLPIQKKLFGGRDKMAVATGLNNLGTVIHNSGRSAEAEPYLREALAMHKRLGNEDKQSAQTLYNLGVVLRELERFPQAESMFRDALVLRRKVLRPNHPDLELTLRYLGRALADQEKFAEAEELFSERLSQVRQNAPGDPEVLESSLNDLAETLFRQKKYAEAEPFYQELVQNRRSRLPPSHDDVWSAKASLARLLADWAWEERTNKSAIKSEKPEVAELAHEGERLLSECLAHRLAGTNAAHWRTSDIRSRLGAAILSVAVTDDALSPAARESKFTEAEALLLAGNEGLQQHQSGRRYQHDAIERLDRLYKAWNKPDRAAEWRARLERFDQLEAEKRSASAREARL
jgi:serine/threonine protein kinase/Tfp pilus assembly protein PilF